MSTPLQNPGPDHPPKAHQRFALERLGIPYTVCDRTGIVVAQARTTQTTESIISGK